MPTGLRADNQRNLCTDATGLQLLRRAMARRVLPEFLRRQSPPTECGGDDSQYCNAQDQKQGPPADGPDQWPLWPP